MRPRKGIWRLTNGIADYKNALAPMQVRAEILNECLTVFLLNHKQANSPSSRLFVPIFPPYRQDMHRLL